MIEHPVPQNVTGYQFHLVGDMTLKQFLELAGGIALAWFIWTFNIPMPIKLVLSVSAALFGFALAFMPLEDRPLDQWVISFFRAIYHPTLFSWKKTAREDILRFKPRPKEKGNPLEAAAKAPAAGLQSLLQMYELQEDDDTREDPLEKDWLARQGQIPTLFRDVQVPKKLSDETTFPRKMAAEPMRPDTQVFVHPLTPPDNLGAILRGEITLAPRQPKIPMPDIPLAEQKGATQVSTSPLADIPMVTGSLPTLQASGARTGTVVATSNMSLLPAMPTSPNVLAGMVFSSDGRIIDNAIVEIRDQQGFPVRALKTNRLGQFTIATPLPNGAYELDVEKEGFRFDILKIEARGEIIAPIEIKAK